MPVDNDDSEPLDIFDNEGHGHPYTSSIPPPSTTIMSSSQQAANATTGAVKSGLNSIGGTNTGASGSIQADKDKDHSAETYDGLTSSGKVCSETTRARAAFL